MNTLSDQHTHIPVVNDDQCCSTMPAISLSPEHAELVADQLKALADPTRLRMLSLLVGQRAAVCVCDITAQFDQHQPTISHHLRLLRQAGLVACEKRGVWAFYWATEIGQHRLTMIETWK